MLLGVISDERKHTKQVRFYLHLWVFITLGVELPGLATRCRSVIDSMFNRCARECSTKQVIARYYYKNLFTITDSSKKDE